MNPVNAPYGASAAMIERRSFDGSVAVRPKPFPLTESEFSMSKSRAEVLASLRGIFSDGEQKPEPTAKTAQPAKVAATASEFARFRKADRVEPVAEEPEIEDEIEDNDDELSEDDVSDSSHEGNGHSDEPADAEVAPVEELLDRVESLIDYISENSEALKAWIAAVR